MTSDASIEPAPAPELDAVPELDAARAPEVVDEKDASTDLEVVPEPDVVTAPDASVESDGGLEPEVVTTPETDASAPLDIESASDAPETVGDGLLEGDAGGADLDVAEADASDADTEVSSAEGLYLVSVDYYGTDLLKIDAATGQTTSICTLEFSTYPSLTFSRENVLYASRSGSSLDIIDPCTCEIIPVGSYGPYGGVNGITSDFGSNLFGVANMQDEFIAISSTEGSAESIGPLGFNFGSTGATWSEADQAVYAIDATSDGLYTISPQTGQATLVATVDKPFGITVGIEMHPGNGVIYACSDDAMLLAVDSATGAVTEIGKMKQSGFCTNLAAPWQPVPCLDAL